MKKINLKGITAEAVTGVLVLLVALINAVLQMVGYNTLPIADDNISNIVSCGRKMYANIIHMYAI